MALLHQLRVRSLLDVGCSTGGFVRIAVDTGLNAYGLEPTEEVVQMIRAHGVTRISSGFFPDQHGPLREYDALTMFHVLMHIAKLTPAFFRSCRDRLVPGGHLLIFCADPSFVNSDDLAPSLTSPISLNFTGEAFMRRAAADAGFSGYRYLPCHAEPLCCFHLLTA